MSIRERHDVPGGRLVVEVYAGRTGGRPVYWRETVAGTTAKSRREAERVEKRLEAQKLANAGKPVTLPPKRQSLGDWLTEYVTHYSGVKRAASARTTNDRAYKLAAYVPLDLRAVSLRDLTQAHIQRWVNTMQGPGKLRRNPKTGKVERVQALLAAQTRINAWSYLRTALNAAVAQKRIAENPAEGVTLPRLPHKEKGRWTEQDLLRFLAAAEGDSLYAYFLIDAYTGARPSEILALKWSDLVADGTELLIQRAMVEDEQGKRVEGDTKTGVVRRIDLSAEIQAALRDHRRVQAAQRLRIGSAYVNGDYIFAGHHGQPYHVTSIPARFHKIRVKAGLPYLKPYNLRHTVASILHDKGTPLREIQQHFDHKDASTTLGYIEARSGATQRTARTMREALGFADAVPDTANTESANASAEHRQTQTSHGGPKLEMTA